VKEERRSFVFVSRLIGLALLVSSLMSQNPLQDRRGRHSRRLRKSVFVFS